MVVQCPGCETKYNVPVEKMGKGPTQLRCSRCGKTFVLKKPPEEPAEPAPAPAEPAPAKPAPAAAAPPPPPKPEPEPAPEPEPEPEPAPEPEPEGAETADIREVISIGAGPAPEAPSPQDLVAQAARAAETATRAAEEAKQATSADEARRLAEEALKAAAAALKAAEAAKAAAAAAQAEPQAEAQAASRQRASTPPPAASPRPAARTDRSTEPPLSERTAELDESELEAVSDTEPDPDEPVEQPEPAHLPPPTPRDAASSAPRRAEVAEPAPLQAEAPIDFPLEDEDVVTDEPPEPWHDAPLEPLPAVAGPAHEPRSAGGATARVVGIVALLVLVIGGAAIYVGSSGRRGTSPAPGAEPSFEGIEATQVDFLEAQLRDQTKVVVVKGVVVNHSLGAWSRVLVKAQVLDQGGAVVMEREAACGRTWDADDLLLRTMLEIQAEERAVAEATREVRRNAGVQCAVVFDGLPEGFSQFNYRAKLIVVRADPMRRQGS